MRGKGPTKGYVRRGTFFDDQVGDLGRREPMKVGKNFTAWSFEKNLYVGFTLISKIIFLFFFYVGWTHGELRENLCYKRLS